MAAGRVVEAVDVSADGGRGVGACLEAVRQMSSDFSVLKNVSIMALSKRFPRPDMEIRMPLAFSSAWYSTEQYRVDSRGRRNTVVEGGTMAGRRRSERVLRDKLRSPGRPPVARQEHRRRFWALAADGRSSEDAAMEVGVSPPVGFRWFRQAGGMAPSHLARSAKPPSGRYLTFAEREEIALLQIQGLGVREIARRLGRAASTVSRELRRNAATRGGNLDYRATTAQWNAERAASRPKVASLAANAALRSYVQDRLAGSVVAPGGVAGPGPAVPWSGRRRGRRQNRRWAMACLSVPRPANQGFSVAGVAAAA